MKRVKFGIDNLLKIVSLTHKFQHIKRSLYVTGEDRRENDSEHSFQLALVGWYLVQSQNLKLDASLVIKYGLVHDLVEVHAGDTFFYTKDQAVLDSKQAREQEAALQISGDFPEFKDLHQIIHSYEMREDDEAKFVYALDKVLPVINIYFDEGKTWQELKITYDMVRTKDNKIAISPEIDKLWKEFVVLLEAKKEIFHPAII